MVLVKLVTLEEENPACSCRSDNKVRVISNKGQLARRWAALPGRSAGEDPGKLTHSAPVTAGDI